MKKILDFLNRYGVIVILLIMILLMMKTCSMNKRIKTSNKSQTEAIQILSDKIDSIGTVAVTSTDLKIEGLKSEKRMIQSCDRKRFDLDRENQIDREISELEKNQKRTR